MFSLKDIALALCLLKSDQRLNKNFFKKSNRVENVTYLLQCAISFHVFLSRRFGVDRRHLLALRLLFAVTFTHLERFKVSHLVLLDNFHLAVFNLREDSTR